MQLSIVAAGQLNEFISLRSSSLNPFAVTSEPRLPWVVLMWSGARSACHGFIFNLQGAVTSEACHFASMYTRWWQLFCRLAFWLHLLAAVTALKWLFAHSKWKKISEHDRFKLHPHRKKAMQSFVRKQNPTMFQVRLSAVTNATHLCRKKICKSW